MTEISRKNIKLEGAPNFRDLGGLPGAGGRTVRHGQVYRSESLARLSDDDLDVIRQLGIGLVVDLRSAIEKQIHPNRLPENHAAETLSIDIDADLRANNESLFHILKANPTRDGARQLLMASYECMPENFSQHLPGLFDRLADADCPPAVLHCTVGKDRTGFAVALLLIALGVPRETIHEDYLVSERYSKLERMRSTITEVTRSRLAAEVDEDMIDTLLGVHGDYLEAAFACIETDHGSIEAYLEKVGKLSDAKRERLCARLLE